MPTYTLVREVDGRPVAVVSALDKETAMQQRQPGLFLVDGEFQGKWKWDGSKMIPFDRDFEQLKIMLESRIIRQEVERFNNPVNTTQGEFRPSTENYLLLQLAEASGHLQEVHFLNGTAKILLHEQLQQISGEIYAALTERIKIREEAYATLAGATKREDLADLLLIYWPEEGTDP